MADDVGEVTVMFCDICDFTDVVNQCQDQIINILDEVFRAFDKFCQMEGVQKIETVGKTYMACGGIKSHEKTLSVNQKMLNPTRRVVNVCRRMMQFIKEFEYIKGKKLKLKIGVHYGSCILGLLGFHKPQFSLIGDTVNTTSRHCTTGEKDQIILSQTAYENVQMDRDIQVVIKKVPMKGKGIVDTYILKESSKKANNTGAGIGFALLTKSFSANYKNSPSLKGISMEKVIEQAKNKTNDEKTKLMNIFKEEINKEAQKNEDLRKSSKFSNLVKELDPIPDLNESQSSKEEQNSMWMSLEDENEKSMSHVHDISGMYLKGEKTNQKQNLKMDISLTAKRVGVKDNQPNKKPEAKDEVDMFEGFQKLKQKRKRGRDNQKLSPKFLHSYYTNILKRNSSKGFNVVFLI